MGCILFSLSNSGEIMNFAELSNTYIDKNENEKQFQEAYDKWDTDTMWYCVFRCNNNIIKSYYKKRKVFIEDDELLAIVTDATAYVMKFILEKGVRPDKLSSYNYLRCLRFITDPKKVWYDTHISQMPQYENGKEVEYGEYNWE